MASLNCFNSLGNANPSYPSLVKRLRKRLRPQEGDQGQEMDTIDYVYRFDPHNPSTKPPPTDAEAARKCLEDGNRMFARWMSSCRTGTATKSEEALHVVQCNGLEVGMVRKEGGVPKQCALRRGNRLLGRPGTDGDAFWPGLQ